MEITQEKINVKKYFFTAALVVFAWIPVQLYFGWTPKVWAQHAMDKTMMPYLVNAIPVIFSAALSLFFLFGSLKLKNILLCVIPYIILFCYLLFLPFPPKENNLGRNVTQAISNAYYFAFVLLWFFVLFSKSNYNFKKLNYKAFVFKCGEIIVWSTIIIIGVYIISVLFAALFDVIDIIMAHIFLYDVFIFFGITASPFISLLISDYDARIKLSPVIANVFLPLILVFLVVFGIMSIFSENKPYDNREIFIIYNVMTVIVICALLFSSINGVKNKFINICAYILPFVTLILNLITISAVLYRLNEYGVSANKIVLLGTNIIMTGHLTFMIYFKIRYNKLEKNLVYLPVYFIWAFFVVFLFPLIFRAV